MKTELCSESYQACKIKLSAILYIEQDCEYPLKNILFDCVKSVQIRRFFWSYFFIFELNTGK